MRRTIMTTATILALGAGVASAQNGPMMPGQTGPGPMGPHGHAIDFAAIDTDGNGTLSRSELQARATDRLARFDTDGDGALDRDELIAAMPGPHGGLMTVFSVDPGERWADRLLAMMGATETGQVEVSALADHRVNMLLAFVDTDRDAAISQAEVEAMQAHGRDWKKRGHDGMQDGPRHGMRGDEGPGRGGDDQGLPPPRG